MCKSQNTRELSNFDSTLLNLQNTLFYDLFIQSSIQYVINAFKATSFAWILLLMRLYNNYSIDMYLYLVLYGSYGILWIVKDIKFPDARWDVKASLGSGISLSVYFCIYWLIPVPLAADMGAQPSSNVRIIFLLVLYLVGLVLMLGSDYQKYHTLKQRPGLISSGFFKYTRNPNYQGESIIYASFALCSHHVLGCVIVFGIAFVLFTFNMYLKDKTSYRFKKGWEEYKEQSYTFLPKVFSSFIANVVLYVVILGAMALFLYQEKHQTLGFASEFNANPQISL